MGAAAHCTQDECSPANVTATCADQNQTCYDPTPLPNDTGDWRCECQAPPQSVKVQAVS